MTFLELRNLVWYYLDDLQGGYFTETQVNVWLNNAQKEVQKRLIKAGQNYYLKCVQTSLVVNQRYYSLPEDFKDLNRLEIVLSGTVPNETYSEIAPITTNQRDLVADMTGTPQFYSLQKNAIRLYPAPDTALTMRLFYSYLVADMTLDTDLPDVPADYHELIALLAAEDGFLKDGRSSELLQKKLSAYERMMDTDTNERLEDLPRGIVQTGQYDQDFGYWW